MDVRRCDGSRVRLIGVGGGSHRFKDAAESNAFIQRFSKALVDALVRGDGSMAVYVDGQIVYASDE